MKMENKIILKNIKYNANGPFAGKNYLESNHVARLAIYWSSGCSSVGRAVASNTRGLWFESSHRQTIILEHLFSLNFFKKAKIKKNRPEMAHFLKKDWQSSRWPVCQPEQGHHTWTFFGAFRILSKSCFNSRKDFLRRNFWPVLQRRLQAPLTIVVKITFFFWNGI